MRIFCCNKSENKLSMAEKFAKVARFLSWQLIPATFSPNNFFCLWSIYETKYYKSAHTSITKKFGFTSFQVPAILAISIASTFKYRSASTKILAGTSIEQFDVNTVTLMIIILNTDKKQTWQELLQRGLKIDRNLKHQHPQSQWNQKYVMFCAIWYHVYNFKTVKNNHGGVLLLVKEY